jgi:hypothetical protein
MLAGVSVLTAPVAQVSPRGFNENHHWLSPLVRLAINLISLTALLGLVLAPDAKADAEDYIDYLDSHGLGCGQGALKCKSEADLIEVGRSVCYDIDKNGQTPNEAADKVSSSGVPAGTSGSAQCCTQVERPATQAAQVTRRLRPGWGTPARYG